MKKRWKNGIKINRMGKELLIGNIIYYIIGQIIILCVAERKFYISFGFFLGVLISTCMVIHMAVVIEQAMCFNEKGAETHIRKTTAIRMVLVMVALIIIGLTDIGNIVAAVMGVMALKVSAYLQPFTHKVLVRKSKEKGG